MKRVTTLSLLLGPALAAGAFGADQVKTANGVVQAAADSTPAVRIFKGIPYAQAPTGELRWKAPQPARAWTGVRPGDSFGPRCMQRSVFADMVLRQQRRERGLPVPERLDAGEVRQGAPVGARAAEEDEVQPALHPRHRSRLSPQR